MKYLRRIWLVTTDHLVDGLWFREMEDFKKAYHYASMQLQIKE